VHLLYIGKCSVDVNGDLTVWIPAGIPFSGHQSRKISARRDGDGEECSPMSTSGTGIREVPPPWIPRPKYYTLYFKYSFNFISWFLIFSYDLFIIKKKLKLYNTRTVAKITKNI